MRKTAAILFIIMCMACAAATAISNHDNLRKRADRFFDNNEWASASAYYTFMLEDSPHIADTYGRAIVSCMMAGDTVRPIQLLKSAMAHKVSLDSVLANVRRYSFAKDSADFYPRFLLSIARNEPWLSRPIDSRLLRYYEQRNNGPMIVKYAGVMLSGMPGNTAFLSSLARGYMLTADYDRAVDTWKRILQADPDNYDTLLQLAAYYTARGENDEARPCYERAYALRPTPYVASVLGITGRKH